MHVTAFLAKHPKVAKMIYSGLATHPQHLLAAKQMSQRCDGYGDRDAELRLPAPKRFVVRLSVGFERIDDLLAELKEGLS
jgi:cystathionine beta-lyase/cystathionine gamma-synthase